MEQGSAQGLLEDVQAVRLRADCGASLGGLVREGWLDEAEVPHLRPRARWTKDYLAAPRNVSARFVSRKLPGQVGSIFVRAYVHSPPGQSILIFYRAIRVLPNR